MTNLAEQKHGAIRRQGSELSDERFEIATLQQLHHIVETAVVGDAEVEDIDSVRRTERRRRLCLALEAAKNHFRIRLTAGAQDLGTNQLDGRVAREQPMFSSPHLSHPAAAEQFHELIAAEILRLPEPPAETLEDVCRQCGD